MPHALGMLRCPHTGCGRPGPSDDFPRDLWGPVVERVAPSHLQGHQRRTYLSDDLESSVACCSQRSHLTNWYINGTNYLSTSIEIQPSRWFHVCLPFQHLAVTHSSFQPRVLKHPNIRAAHWNRRAGSPPVKHKRKLDMSNFSSGTKYESK